jgi:hypothetical protein
LAQARIDVNNEINRQLNMVQEQGLARVDTIYDHYLTEARETMVRVHEAGRDERVR